MLVPDKTGNLAVWSVDIIFSIYATLVKVLYFSKISSTRFEELAHEISTVQASKESLQTAQWLNFQSALCFPVTVNAKAPNLLHLYISGLVNMRFMSLDAGIL